ncbi:MAG: hypothetical protein ACLQNG_04410 [Acidimicrobiales bacterium]
MIGTGGLTIIRFSARHGAPRRVVEACTAVVAVLVPGVTALLLVLAARASLRVRAVIGLLLAAVGVAAFFYLPHGMATGVALLALVAAAIAVLATGPLVAAPLVALAALIATLFLPRLLASRSKLPNAPVAALHQALFTSAGSPLWLRIAVLVVAALPFGLAARLVVR